MKVSKQPPPWPLLRRGWERFDSSVPQTSNPTGRGRAYRCAVQERPMAICYTIPDRRGPKSRYHRFGFPDDVSACRARLSSNPMAWAQRPRSRLGGKYPRTKRTGTYHLGCWLRPAMLLVRANAIDVIIRMDRPIFTRGWTNALEGALCLRHDHCLILTQSQTGPQTVGEGKKPTGVAPRS